MAAVYVGSEHPRFVLMCGLHGDEIEGQILCSALFQKLKSEADVSFACLFGVNPDGLAAHSRWNARDVDLNRNFPTKIWSPVATNPRYPPGPFAASEPETRALVGLMERLRPRFVLDFHSYKTSVVLPSIKRHGPLEQLIAQYGAALGIPVEYDQEGLGYSITGGFHDWCLENGINNVTVEVGRNLPQDTVLATYLEPTFDFVSKVAIQLKQGGF
jgi:protein MpaA